MNYFSIGSGHSFASAATLDDSAIYYHWFLSFSFCRREDKFLFVKGDYGDRENSEKCKWKEEGFIVDFIDGKLHYTT